jgi:hypothetical protein
MQIPYCIAYARVSMLTALGGVGCCCITCTQASKVAPVVITSSTSNTCLLAMCAPSATSKACSTLPKRSTLDFFVCESVITTRRSASAYGFSIPSHTPLANTSDWL